MSHTLHNHVRLGTGVVWCPKTRLVYIRADDVPRGKGSKLTDDGLLFASVRKRLLPHLRRAKLSVLGWVLIDPSLSLPRGVSDWPDLVSYVFARDKKREEQPS